MGWGIYEHKRICFWLEDHCSWLISLKKNIYIYIYQIHFVHNGSLPQTFSLEEVMTCEIWAVVCSWDGWLVSHCLLFTCQKFCVTDTVWPWQFPRKYFSNYTGSKLVSTIRGEIYFSEIMQTVTQRPEVGGNSISADWAMSCNHVTYSTSEWSSSCLCVSRGLLTWNVTWD